MASLHSLNYTDIADKIYRKTLAVCARSGSKIPYTAVNGVFDDQSENNICWWTNGFWAGQLWQLYGSYGGDSLRRTAEEIERKLDRVFFIHWGMDHDSGFRWLPTSGARYRLTGAEDSKNRLIVAANDLAGRFNLAGGFIRAWNDNGDGSKAGWAIIDCLMNLPLLYFASDELHDPRFRQIAIRHAETTISAFLRHNGSVCHIVEFDPSTGKRLRSHGGQGYGHGSSWTRGQAWALYGFTLSYIHTLRGDFLSAAKKVADHFISRIPKSGFIPIDFDQPPKPAYEDSTAAAIASCGLIELSRAANDSSYLAVAERLIKALCENRCRFDDGCDYLLEKCSVAYHDHNHEFPIIYGDYFLTEAVLKLTGKETFIW